MPKLSHNKKRNVGLVYEFLAREMTQAVISKDRALGEAVMGIIQNHLSEGCPLHETLSLHQKVMETRGVSERLARRIVDELKAAGIRASRGRMMIEDAKTALIHEINKTLGRDVFDRHRIPSYSVHASIGILISRGLGGRLDEGVDVARVEDHLIEFLTGPVAEPVRFDADASLYAYKTALSLFENEYGRELTGPQAELLREYVRVSVGGNVAPFERTFERQRAEVHQALRLRRLDEVFTADPEMSQRLDEALADLSTLRPTAEDECVERLMLYHNLLSEVES